MLGEFLIILLFICAMGFFAQKYLKKHFSRVAFPIYPFLLMVLTAGALLDRSIPREIFEEIFLGLRKIVLLTLLVLGGFYLLFAVIIPWLREKRGKDGDFSPEYKEYRQEEEERKRFLHAILHGDVEVVRQMLVTSPERIYLRGPKMEHPADYALKQGKQAMAEFLREFERAFEKKKETLKRAVMEGNASNVEEIVSLDRYLVKVSLAASGLSALHLAVERNNIALALFFIEQGANLEAKDREGAGPLHYAAALGHLEATSLLIERGADVSARDNGGVQPLHGAAMSGHVAVAQLLIEHGADLNRADEVLRWTPLYYAEYYDRREMVDFLLEKGATLSVRDTFGRPPRSTEASDISISPEVIRAQERKRKVDDLLAAIHAKDTGMVAGMLEEEPFLANETHDGKPIFHHAVYTRNEPIIRTLLENGALVNGKDDRGSTPLCSVIFGGFDKSSHGETAMLVRLLLEHGADPNIVDDISGFSPLHHTVQNDNRRAAELLIEHGADINSNVRKLGTPLYWAECRGTPQMVKFLKDRGARR